MRKILTRKICVKLTLLIVVQVRRIIKTFDWLDLF